MKSAGAARVALHASDTDDQAAAAGTGRICARGDSSGPGRQRARALRSPGLRVDVGAGDHDGRGRHEGRLLPPFREQGRPAPPDSRRVRRLPAGRDGQGDRRERRPRRSAVRAVPLFVEIVERYQASVTVAFQERRYLTGEGFEAVKPNATRSIAPSSTCSSAASRRAPSAPTSTRASSRSA